MNRSLPRNIENGNIQEMFIFAFKFIIFLYIFHHVLESIATFGYVNQFFLQLQKAIVCLKIHFEQILQLHIFFVIHHCSFVNKNLFLFRTRGVCESSC